MNKPFGVMTATLLALLALDTGSNSRYAAEPPLRLYCPNMWLMRSL